MNKSLTSRIVALVCLGLFTLQSFAGTVTGQVQNAAAGPVRNGTFSFTLTAPATVAGTATVVTSSVPCYTDGNGNVAGEPDPLLAPVLSVNLASGTLPAATYFVKIWYFDGTGNSFVSPEASISLVSIGTLNVLSPAKQPLNASGFRVGISTTTGTETLQGSVTGVPGAWGNFSQSVALVAGTAMPVSNTTVCTLRFNDELTPSFTCYDVGLTSSTGASIPGFPQYWYLNGGSAGTINVGSGTPQSNVCQGQGVVYPQAIVTLPPFNATQTVNGGLNITGPVTATAGQNSFNFFKANGKTVVDGNKYPLSAAGINQAITDAAANGTYEVDLPCADISINTTVNENKSDVSLVGCAGGDLNLALTSAVTRFIAVPPLNNTQDVLNIDCSPSRCTGVRVYNLMIDGNGIARYALRQNSQDTTYLENVKVRGGLTANHYHVNSTGTMLINYQNNCQQTGGAGLVIDWGSSIFNAYSASWDTGGCNPSTGPLLWIGGGSNRNIKFDGSQMNINAATPTGFILVTGYDTVSPWASAGTPVVGAPDTVTWNGLDLLYGANSPAAASQGADVLINGTATNRPSNIYFDHFKFDARLSATPGQIAVKSDNAQNVNLSNGTSQGHTAGSACTLNLTANTFSPGGHMFNVNSTNVTGSDTFRTCGTVSSIADLTFVFSGLKLNSQNVLTDTSTNTVTGKAFTGATTGNNLSILNAQGAIAALTGNSADQVVYTYSLPANTVDTTSKGILITCGLAHNSGTANPSVKININGVAAATGSIGTTASQSVTTEVKILRTASTTGGSIGKATSAGNLVPFTQALGGLAWTGAQTITCTFNVANTDQMTGVGFLVEQVQ